MPPRFCEWCGRPIQSREKKVRFCSHACATKASRTRDYSKADPAILREFRRDPAIHELVHRQVWRFHLRCPWVDLDELNADAWVAIWQALSTAKLDAPKPSLLAYLAQGIWLGFCKRHVRHVNKVMLNSVSADLFKPGLGFAVLSEGAGDPGTRGPDSVLLGEVLDFIESEFGREWRDAMLAIGAGATMEEIGAGRGVTREAIRQKTAKIRERLAQRFGRG